MSRAFVCIEATDIETRRPQSLDLSDVADESIATLRAIDALFGAGVCRGCGCTDGFACEGGCSWFSRGLCSACAGSSAPGMIRL